MLVLLQCLAVFGVWYLVNKKLDRIQQERTAKMKAIMEERRRQNKFAERHSLEPTF